MQEFNADLHFHGLYSAAVSKDMLIPKIAEQAKLKGLHLISSADILHKKWFKHVKDNIVEEENGIFKYKHNDVKFVLGTEIQNTGRVHNIMFFPDFNSVLDFRKKIEKYASDLDVDGRCRISQSTEQVAQKAEEAGALIGPAHAFTPYYSVYAFHDTLEKAYGNMADKIKFIELGLSADTYWADMIPELRKRVFLTNSDCHSPYPHRLGREFNRVLMQKPSFKEIRKALSNEGGRKLTLNAGFDPKEGKYHSSGCNSCYQLYNFEQGQTYSWKCPKCGKSIKRGVKDRIKMLSDGQSKSPDFRPEYLHIVPLAEIIARSIGIKNPAAKKVQEIWDKFVERFGTEIQILIDEPTQNLIDFNPEIGRSIKMFREGKTIMLSGGGGNYGQLIIPKNDAEFKLLKEKYKDRIDGFYKEDKSVNLKSFM